MLPEPFDLAGRVALVTGAGSSDGIGFATARLLGELGARVALAATTDRVHDRAGELKDVGIEAFGVVADLTDEVQVRRAVDEVIRELGGPDDPGQQRRDDQRLGPGAHACGDRRSGVGSSRRPVPRAVAALAGPQPRHRLPVHPRGPPRDEAGGLGTGRDGRLGHRPGHGDAGRGGVRRGQGRHGRTRPLDRGRLRRRRDHRQRGRARLDPDSQPDRRRGTPGRADPRRPQRGSRRGRGRRGLPVLAPARPSSPGSASPSTAAAPSRRSEPEGAPPPPPFNQSTEAPGPRRPARTDGAHTAGDTPRPRGQTRWRPTSDEFRHIE